MLKYKGRGFTLIEILLIIAVIGILTTISLVPLANARNKAKDSKIQQNLSQVRTIAASISGLMSSYVALCNTADNTLCDNIINCAGNNFTNQLKKIEEEMASQGGVNNCYSSDSAFCVSSSANLVSFYCVDKEGVLKITSSACSAAGPCP